MGIPFALQFETGTGNKTVHNLLCTDKPVQQLLHFSRTSSIIKTKNIKVEGAFEMAWQHTKVVTKDIVIYVLENNHETPDTLRYMVNDCFGHLFSEGTIRNILRGEYDRKFSINHADYGSPRSQRGRSNSSPKTSNRSHYRNDDYTSYGYQSSSSPNRRSSATTNSYRGNNRQNYNVSESEFPEYVYQDDDYVSQPKKTPPSYQPTSYYTGKIHIAPEDNPFSPEYKGSYRSKSRNYGSYSNSGEIIGSLLRRFWPILLFVIALLIGTAVKSSGGNLLGSIGNWFDAQYWSIRLVHHSTISRIATGFLLLGDAAIGWDRFVDDSLPFFFDLAARHVAMTLIALAASLFLFAYVSFVGSIIALGVAIVFGIKTWQY